MATSEGGYLASFDGVEDSGLLLLFCKPNWVFLFLSGWVSVRNPCFILCQSCENVSHPLLSPRESSFYFFILSLGNPGCFQHGNALFSHCDSPLCFSQSIRPNKALFKFLQWSFLQKFSRASELTNRGIQFFCYPSPVCQSPAWMSLKPEHWTLDCWHWILPWKANPRKKVPR